MSVTFDATAKGTTANSYCTVQEADDVLLSQRLYATEWSAQSTQQKQALLMWATFLLDSVMAWNGEPRTIAQALRWPRYGVDKPDGNGQYDYDTIPRLVIRGTAELALELAKRDRTAEPKLLGQGFSQVHVGTVRITVDKAQVLDLIPRQIIAVLGPVGWPDDDGGLSGSVRLVRS